MKSVSPTTAEVDIPAFGRSIAARSDSGFSAGDKITLAVRPEKIMISRDEPAGPNAIPGVVSDLGYFGKDSLYKVVLASGAIVSVNSVNARRADESGRIADWDEKVWLSFDPTSAILLND